MIRPNYSSWALPKGPLAVVEPSINGTIGQGEGKETISLSVREREKTQSPYRSREKNLSVELLSDLSPYRWSSYRRGDIPVSVEPHSSDRLRFPNNLSVEGSIGLSRPG